MSLKSKKQKAVKGKTAVKRVAKKNILSKGRINVARKVPRRRTKHPRPVDVGRIQGKLLYSVSEKYLHPEVQAHKHREAAAEQRELALLMGKKYA